MVNVPFFFIRLEQVIERVEDLVGMENVFGAKYLPAPEGMMSSRIKLSVTKKLEESITITSRGKKFYLIVRGFSIEMERAQLNGNSVVKRNRGWEKVESPEKKKEDPKRVLKI